MGEVAEVAAVANTPPAMLDADAVEQVLAHAPIGILIEGVDGRVLWRNAAIEQVLGVINDGSEGGVEAWTTRAAERSLGCTRVALVSEHAAAIDGQARAVCYFLPLSGSPAIRDSLLRLLDARPGLDRDTGVLDASGINRALQTEVSRSRRYGNPLSVVVLRVGSGPDSLRAVARILKEELRWADLVGRTEQQELLVVLPETDAEAASHLLVKVRGMLAHDADVRLGAAGWQRGDDGDALLRRAGEALSVQAGDAE